MRSFLSYAFRPFFLLNGLFAIVAVAVWVFALHGVVGDTLPADIVYWHGHEMLVGFAMAAIAGFILTAVATWTGRPAVQGAPLALLVLAWLTGRLAMAISGVLPATVVAVLDMLFPVLLVIFVAREVLGSPAGQDGLRGEQPGPCTEPQGLQKSPSRNAHFSPPAVLGVWQSWLHPWRVCPVLPISICTWQPMHWM